MFITKNYFFLRRISLTVHNTQKIGCYKKFDNLANYNYQDKTIVSKKNINFCKNNNKFIYD